MFTKTQNLTTSCGLSRILVTLDPDSIDQYWRSADIRIQYPGIHLADLGDVMSPFIRLEIGSARVVPFVACDLCSFVHDGIAERSQLDKFMDNRPKGVRCVHPFVTLLEKFDALHRRFPKAEVEPATFVRHFEDAARIISAAPRLPPFPEYDNVRFLAVEMLGRRQIAELPSASSPALAPSDDARWVPVRAAHAAIGHMFWGSRITLEDACAEMRAWAEETFG